MKRFVEGGDRRQATLLPDSLEDYVTEDNPVRVVDVFIDELDLEALGFSGVAPGGHHPATLLKIYLYGYLNRIQSSRRLEREKASTQHRVDVADRPTGRRSARRARSSSCCAVSSTFSRGLSVAIDGSKFKAVNNRDKNFTVAKVAKRIEQVEGQHRALPGGLGPCRPGGRRYGQGQDNPPSTHFLTRTLEKVKTEMSLQVLAYNMKRMINIFGVNPLMQAIAA